MKRRGLRLSIAGMLGSLVLFGIVFAALAKPGGLVAILFPTVTGFILLGAVLAAWIGPGHTFWRGFSVFGVGFLLMNCMQPRGDPEDFTNPLLNHRVAKAGFVRLHGDLIKRLFLSQGERQLKQSEIIRGEDPLGVPLGEILEIFDWQDTAEYSSFQDSILNIFVLLHALAGGGLALFLASWRGGNEVRSPEGQAS